MDGRQFDSLTKSLARRTSRRRVITGLAAAVAGALANRVGQAAAVAATCPPGQFQGSGGRCLCKATGRLPGPEGCPCPPGWAQCPSGCQPAGSPTDPSHCGPCSQQCPAPADECQVAICSDGTCGTAPASPGTPCQGGDGECNGSGQCVQTCLPLQTHCPGNDDACCQSDAPTTCANTDGLGTVCCRRSGQPCVENLDCCGGYGFGSQVCRGGICL